LRHPPSSLSTSSALSEKVGSGLSKRPPYSRVQQWRQLHAATTHSGESRPWSVPPQRTFHPRSCRLPATDQPSLWTPQPLPQHCHHHRQFPRLVSFPGPWPVPTVRGQHSCTAAEYSNAADQHRPTTFAIGQRPAQITTIDRPARSSGRRGRGFKSRHPDTLECQVRSPHRWTPVLCSGLVQGSESAESQQTPT
jgi:hypothetical protein